MAIGAVGGGGLPAGGLVAGGLPAGELVAGGLLTGGLVAVGFVLCGAPPSDWHDVSASVEAVIKKAERTGRFATMDRR